MLWPNSGDKMNTMNNKLQLGNKTRALKTVDISESLGKVPPQSIDLEEAVLGALLIESNTIHEVIADLFFEMFYKQSHQEIARAILQLYEDSKNIDILTVTEQLRKNETLEIAGGAYYVTELTSKVNSSAHIHSHILIVKEKWLRRELIHISSEYHRRSYEDKNDVFDDLDNVMSDYLQLSERLNGSNELTMKTAALETYRNLEDARIHKRKAGMNTGFVDIDRTTGGWMNGDLILIAARPSMGKTALVLQTAKYVAQSKPVLAFSIEMTRNKFITRMICSVAQVDYEKFKDPRLFTNDEWKKVQQATEYVSSLNLTIDEGSLSFQQLRAKAIIHKKKHGLGLIVIDYLQLMDMPEAANKNNAVEIITRHLKLIAKELNVPIICLSQLSRAPETRGGSKRPQLSDLRDSGAIEQDADVVAFIYRSEYYDIAPADEHGNPMEEGTTEIIFAKNREGKVGKVYLVFKGEHVSFYDYVDFSTSEVIEGDWWHK